MFVQCLTTIVRKIYNGWNISHNGFMLQRTCICSHMCVRRLRRAFSADAFLKHTVQSAADGWHMWPEVPACTMTQEFTPRFQRALPSTAALLTRAQRFNYWPVLHSNFISWATQEIASRSVKVVTELLDSEGRMYTHCSSVQLIVLWIVGRLHNGKLEAYARSTG